MGYQIKYDASAGSKRITNRKIWLKYGAIGLLTVVMIGAAVWSLGADWAVTVSALEGMAVDLEQGSGLKEAFSAFCLEVLKGAEIG